MQVHGLLHLLGFDHEISEEAEAEMEREEELLLKSLGWIGKGLIQSACDAETHLSSHQNSSDEALSRGVKIVIATGKARPTAIDIFKTVDRAGKDGVVSEFSPGVFLQACTYSLENKVPLVAFCEGRCLTLFDHPLVDSVHTVYHEPKAEVTPSTEHLLAAADIQGQQLIAPQFVQAVPDILEIVPLIMAIGDGENDIEMLELASLGIALSNGAEKIKAVANVIGFSNDKDGVADAIYRYAF
ncbi:hypothetical protein K1719_022514 [Acacia pycnantha]|nr:hypothetical protein K1719_022514 [Acacia pycnantha]